MAEPTPWQIANAGQRRQTSPVTRVVFSNGTEPWPYAPHVEIVANGTDDGTQFGVYGVNNPAPPASS